MRMGVIVALVAIGLVAFLITWLEQAPARQKAEEEIKKQAQYSTILNIEQRAMGSGQCERELLCKDGIVYNNRGREMGRYSLRGDQWTVISTSEEEPVEIGHFYQNSDRIYLSLHGVSEFVRKKGPLRVKNRNTLWCAAEYTPTAVIDSETYETIGFFKGDRLGAAAAFICWAYEGYQNKYSDFYSLEL